MNKQRKHYITSFLSFFQFERKKLEDARRGKKKNISPPPLVTGKPCVEAKMSMQFHTKVVTRGPCTTY